MKWVFVLVAVILHFNAQAQSSSKWMTNLPGAPLEVIASPDEKWVAVLHKSLKEPQVQLSLISQESGAVKKKIVVDSIDGYQLAFTPDSRFFHIQSNYRSNRRSFDHRRSLSLRGVNWRVQVFDTATLQEVGDFRKLLPGGEPQTSNETAYDPVTQALTLTLSEGTIVRMSPNENPREMEFQPERDGQLLAVSAELKWGVQRKYVDGEREYTLWALTNGRRDHLVVKLEMVDAGERVRDPSVARFIAPGRLMTLSISGGVNIYEVPSGERVAHIPASEKGSMWGVHLSRSGRFLGLVETDGVSVWDLSVLGVNKLRLCSIPGSTPFVRRPAFLDGTVFSNDETSFQHLSLKGELAVFGRGQRVVQSAMLPVTVGDVATVLEEEVLTERQTSRTLLRQRSGDLILSRDADSFSIGLNGAQ